MSSPSYKFDGKVLSVNSVQEGLLVRLGMLLHSNTNNNNKNIRHTTKILIQVTANNTVWAAGTNQNGRLGIGSSASTVYNFVEVWHFFLLLYILYLI